jgi:hypothetical protein
MTSNTKETCFGTRTCMRILCLPIGGHRRIRSEAARVGFCSVRREPPLSRCVAIRRPDRAAARAMRWQRKLLERHLCEASEFARMQAFPILSLEFFQRLQPDLEMLADTLVIEIGGHASKLYFTMEGLIRDAE